MIGDSQMPNDLRRMLKTGLCYNALSTGLPPSAIVGAPGVMPPFSTLVE